MDARVPGKSVSGVDHFQSLGYGRPGHPNVANNHKLLKWMIGSGLVHQTLVGSGSGLMNHLVPKVRAKS